MTPEFTYGLVSAGKNEEMFIETTLRSVLRQSRLPARWVIVDDGSADRTGEIIRRYADRYSFITALSLPASQNRSFGAQYRALRQGYEMIKDAQLSVVGFLDTDIELSDCKHYERLIEEFIKDERLGLAGGFIHEKKDGVFRNRSGNRVWSVAGGNQTFRRDCFDAIGGYVPLEYGGSDSLAEAMARMQGWHVKSIPALPVLHYRPTSSAGGRWRGAFRLGLMDASFGNRWVFEMLKCSVRLGEPPVFVGGLVRFFGYLSFHLRRDEPVIPQDVARYLRREQRQRVAALLRFQGNIGAGLCC